MISCCVVFKVSISTTPRSFSVAVATAFCFKSSEFLSNKLFVVSVTAFCAETALRCLINVDRKSTRLNSSHVSISYAVFCLKKKKGERVLATVLEVVVDNGMSNGRQQLR